MHILLSRTIETLSTERVGVLIFVVVVGFAAYGLLLDIAYYVVVPVLGAAAEVNLLQDGLHVGGGELGDNEIYLGRLVAPVFALLISLLLGVGLLPKMWHRAEDDMRACPFCLSDIPLEATKCAYCASEVTPVAIED